MSEISELVNTIRQSNLDNIADQKRAREEENRGRLEAIKDERSLITDKKNTARLEKENLQKELAVAAQKMDIGGMEKLTRELEKAEEKIVKLRTSSEDLEKAQKAVADASKEEQKEQGVTGAVEGGMNLGLGTDMLIEEAKRTNESISANEEILSLMKAEAEKSGLDINKNQKFLALSAKTDREKLKLEGINAGRIQGMFKRISASIPSREELKEQSRVFAGISNTLEGVSAGIGGFAKSVGGKAKDALGGVFGMIKGLMKGALLIAGLVAFRAFINSPYFKQMIDLIKNTIIPAFQRMIETLKPPIMEFIRYLGEVIPKVFEDIFGPGGFIDNAILALTGVFDFLKGIFTGDVELIKQGVKKIFTGVINAFDKALEAVLEFFGVENFSIIDSIVGIYNKVKDFFVNISDKIGSIVNAIKQFVKDKVDAFKSFFGFGGDDDEEVGKLNEDTGKPARDNNPFAGQGQTAGGDATGSSILEIQNKRTEAQERTLARKRKREERLSEIKGEKVVVESQKQRVLRANLEKERAQARLDEDRTITGDKIAAGSFDNRFEDKLAIDQSKPTSVIAPTTNVTNNSNTSTVSIMGPQNPDRGMTLAAEAADF